MQALIYGSKSYARLIAQLAQELGYQIEGLLDDSAEAGLKPYAAERSRILGLGIPVLIGIGYSNLEARARVLQTLLKDGVKLPNLIHARAFVSPAAKLGVGNVVMALGSIDAFSEIGSGNVFWPSSTISHDVTVGDNTFFSPASTVCGFTRIGSSVFIGANSVVVDHREVPTGTFVKAGSVFQ